MTGWILSLILSLAISLAGFYPTAVEANLAKDFDQQLHELGEPNARATVHLTADPVFQLPFGVIPKLTADITGISAGGILALPIDEFHIEVDDVHVPRPFGRHEAPYLLQPAPAALTVGIARTSVQATLLRLLGTGPIFAKTVPLLGHIEPSLQDVNVAFADGHVVVTGNVSLKPGASLRSFACSLVLSAADHDALSLAVTQLRLGSITIPPMLVRSFFPPMTLFKLSQLLLLAGEWKLEEPILTPNEVVLRVTGTLETVAHPGHKP